MKTKKILALGGDIKNQWLVASGRKLFFGPETGDLSLPENYARFKDGISRFLAHHKINPAVVAHDLHPGYFSTRFARENKWQAPFMAVQHHHAHIASILYEYDLKQPVIGVAFDGTGYGTDGNTWGGEFLHVDKTGFKRLAHLKYLRMPGADMVVQEPWRMVLSILGKKARPIIHAARKAEMELVLVMLSKGINCPVTSSAGRLFDAAAAILGVCQVAKYEAEGPIKLEALCQKDLQKGYDFGISRRDGLDVIDPLPVFEGLFKDLTRQKSSSEIATKFHNTIIEIIVKAVKKISKATGVKDVALSGGVFQNKYLKDKTVVALEKNQFNVYLNRDFPANDLNIALGQFYVSSHSGKN